MKIALLLALLLPTAAAADDGYELSGSVPPTLSDTANADLVPVQGRIDCNSANSSRYFESTIQAYDITGDTITVMADGEITIFAGGGWACQLSDPEADPE